MPKYPELFATILFAPAVILNKSFVGVVDEILKRASGEEMPTPTLPPASIIIPCAPPEA